MSLRLALLSSSSSNGNSCCKTELLLIHRCVMLLLYCLLLSGIWLPKKMKEDFIRASQEQFLWSDQHYIYIEIYMCIYKVSSISPVELKFNFQTLGRCSLILSWVSGGWITSFLSGNVKHRCCIESQKYESHIMNVQHSVTENHVCNTGNTSQTQQQCGPKWVMSNLVACDSM